MKITQTGSVLFATAWLGVVIASAMPPDPKLLSLVPPDSQIVAGAAAPMEDRNRGNFLFFTRANTLDLADFFAIVGTDASHRIYQVIFTASERAGSANPEHSLLVSGDFDRERIYMSAEAKSAATNYHGVKVLVLPPFERERAFLKQDRWLAVINSRLAIFGTVASAQEEIDRFLGEAAAEKAIVQKLSSLRRADDTWCLISSLVFGAEIPRVLKNLDPAFGDIDMQSDTILFGIRYGRQIEFEYVANAQVETGPVPITPAETSVHPTNRGLTFARDSEPSRGSGFRRVVKVSRSRYDRWLTDLTAH